MARKKIMKLYKYKSLENFEFSADILLNNRLYAADFRELNDPMEGMFTYNKDEELDFINQIVDEKRKLRICSLAKDMTNPILWAHYANGFRGICIELEIDMDNPNIDLVELQYSMFTPIAEKGYKDSREGKEYKASDWARLALEGKFEEWNYEREFRLFSSEKYIESGFQITAIYLGLRISPIYRDIIHKIAPASVKVMNTLMGDSNYIMPEYNFLSKDIKV